MENRNDRMTNLLLRHVSTLIDPDNDRRTYYDVEVIALAQLSMIAHHWLRTQCVLLWRHAMNVEISALRSSCMKQPV